MTGFLTDSLLIANPAVSDNPKFENIAGRAVYIVEHSDKGAVGVSLNQNYSKRLEELAGNLPLLAHLSPDQLVTEGKVIAGGPLFIDRPWLLSRNPKRYQGTMGNDSLRLSFDQNAFHDCALKHMPCCGVGTFGWGAGQLEQELAHSLWHHFPSTLDVLESIPFDASVVGAADLLAFMKYTDLKPRKPKSRFLNWGKRNESAW
ncbi:MAG: YqgE/AlgH family protein [Marinobacter sp.]|uniref:YqgE/AlgH family protein n=1 Tax=Marinobacter sp. TaxID=50741 RepID=UPI00299D83BA|nr:YqgE/AlgH family protein [Marinobacter sp.]MDX1757691.1 YqgE/AlgH family protein [Marinobacter sp.]